MDPLLDKQGHEILSYGVTPDTRWWKGGEGVVILKGRFCNIYVTKSYKNSVDYINF